MTQTQRTMLNTALTRAIAQGILVIGEGTLKATGARVWFVTSGTGNDAGYMIVQVSPDTLTCTCKAGQKGVYCKHRAIITARLIQEDITKMSQDVAHIDSTLDRMLDESIMQRHDGGPRLFR